MVRRLTLAFALISSMALVVLAPPHASAATWGPDVRLVFSRAGDIWIAHPDGSHLANLTNSPTTVEMAPTLSRTGRYVAYQTISGVQATINVYDAQTGTHTALITGAQPDFSPVADVIAFNRYESGTFGIYSVNLDGTDLKTWVAGPDASVSPQWAPDGQSLLYIGTEGTRSCNVDMGGYYDVYYASRLRRVSVGGGKSVVAGDDTVAIGPGQEGGGSLAYLSKELPPTDSQGFCVTTPSAQFSLVVDGVAVAADAYVRLGFDDRRRCLRRRREGAGRSVRRRDRPGAVRRLRT